MSKNFEDEYRHMIEEDIPDLWDRIEAQLPKDTAAAAGEISNASDQTYIKQPDTVSAHQSYEQVSSQIKEQQSSKNNKKKIFTRRRVIAWGSLAAAVFAIFIMMPILVMMSAKRGGSFAPPMNDSFTNIPSMDAPQSGGGMYDMEYAPMEAPSSIEQGYSYNGTGDSYAPEPGASSYEPDYDRQDGMLAGETEAAPWPDEQYVDGELITHSIDNNSEGKETDLPEDDALESAVEMSSEVYQAEVKILSAVPTEEGSILYEAEIQAGSEEDWDSGWREGARLFLMFKEEDENNGAINSVRVGRSYMLSMCSSGEEVERYGIGVSQPGNSESSVYRTGIYIISAVEKQTMQ